MHIPQCLVEQAAIRGEKPAFIFDNSAVSFRELERNVLRLAHILSQKGVAKGDAVGFYLPNCVEYVYGYLAVLALGAVAVPLDYMLKREELVSCLSHAECRLLLARPKPGVDWLFVQEHVETLKTICEVGAGDPSPHEGVCRWEDEMSAASVRKDFEVLDPVDPALIMYTSGTTGRPKGILLNRRHLDGSPAALKHFVDLSDRDVKLCAIPLSHIAGFMYVQNCLLFGITVVLMERFHPLEFLRNIERYRVTCFHIVPAMYTALLTLKHIAQFDLSSLRWAVVFGAPSSPEILERFHTYCPNAALLNGWGMTETCPPNAVTPLGSDNIISVGKTAPHCEIRIVDGEGHECPAGGVGEIVIRGWVVMEGYYKDPEATAEVVRNGWLHTGDLGRFDNDGYLYIVGRKKDMIKVGGQIVYAPEVEAAFYKFDAVAEAAVIGVPDALRGEVVKAFVVFKDGENMAPEELRYRIRDHLAHFKIPHDIEVRDSLPKNRTGKIDKHVLKENVPV